MSEKCLFSFYLSEEDIDIAELSVKRKFGKYKLSIDCNTLFDQTIVDDKECIVFGWAVNVIDGNSENIAKKITTNCDCIQDVVEFEKNLGGKYVIFFRKGNNYYIQCDATCSVPVFYNIIDSFICSSNFQYIVKEKKYETDKEYLKIRKSGDISQAMPFDITQYKKIKQLIPNHYLDIINQKSIRFINSCYKQKNISIEETTNVVTPMINNIVNFYKRNFKIYCPLTAGRDSRVVLSFLMKNNVNFSCYTIKHPEHIDNTQDILLPKIICEQNNIEYKLIEDIVLSELEKREIDRILGENNYSQRTLRIGKTVNRNFRDGVILNGDIIGQVGKCSLHRDIPLIFATPSYFRCKMHNYSKESKKILKLWLNEIKISGEKVNTFDLFSIENRMGRWAAQENLIYNILGQLYLNIFNSRSIIYVWTAVKRRKRKKTLIHLNLIERTNNQLLNVDFEKDESIIIKLSKCCGIAYLLASYVKFYIERRKFERRK